MTGGDGMTTAKALPPLEIGDVSDQGHDDSMTRVG